MKPVRDSWYTNVTGYQWLVLVVASLGWMFDAFEGQIYNLTHEMLPDLLQVSADDPLVKVWGNAFCGNIPDWRHIWWAALQLAGRSLGEEPGDGAITILFYSLFSGLTAFASEIWQVGLLRFLVAMGVGGEWAVGAALVAEVFPKEARERAGGIFHATSVGGLWLAAAVGFVGSAPSGDTPI